jgi:hypothetical protein
MDSGSNLPENQRTLLAQQKRMLSGKRHVQMFPKGTAELPLPSGYERTETDRGVFHYNSQMITADQIRSFSHRENELLELGPFNKLDILSRLQRGEKLTCVTEFDKNGNEVRCAAATPSTVPIQLAYFEKTKDENNTVMVGAAPERLRGIFDGR